MPSKREKLEKAERFIRDNGWKKQRIFHPSTRRFVEREGFIGRRLVTTLTPKAAYDLIWTPEVMQHIKVRLNQRMAEREAKERYLNHGRPLKPVSNTELQTYFAVILAMSVAPSPSFPDYWKTEHHGDNVLGNKFVRNRISRDRFLLIHRCLHFDLEWLMAELMKNSQSCWKPYRRVVIDETLVAFKGRCKWRVKMLRKPKQTGIKLWTVADSKGYLWAWSLYKKRKETSTATLLRMDSMLPQGQPHRVYADAYFGSLQGAEKLSERNREFVLAVRKDRPSDIFANYLDQDLDQGYWDSVVKHTDTDDFIATTFSSSKVIHFLSNVVSDEPTEDGAKPMIAEDYSEHMHSVDEFDQNVAYLLFPHKSYKWSHKLFFWFHKLAVTQAWTIWKEVHQKEIPQGTFMRQLMYELSPTGKHEVTLQASTGNCKLCERQGKTSKSNYKCAVCGWLHRKCYPIMHAALGLLSWAHEEDE
jgi:hypothetical protein